MTQTDQVTLASYLWCRLHQLGLESLHGVPGDFNLTALDFVEPAGLKWIGDSNELNAGYAADGYARIKGIGALLTTFGVGELSAINAIAGSFAEHVPVVHIVGSPAVGAQKKNLLVHHTLGNGNFKIFGEIYQRVTVAQAHLHDVKTATSLIDETLRQCQLQSRPVYIELPSDMAMRTVDTSLLHAPIVIAHPKNEPAAESAAVEAILERLYSARRPCVLIDVWVSRRRLTKEVDTFLRKTNLPVFTTIMGKGAVDESLPNFCGTYSGRASYDTIREHIEASDLVISIGPLRCDTNTFGFSFKLSTNNCIDLHNDTVTIGYSHFNLHVRGVLDSLTTLIEPHRLQIQSIQHTAVRTAADSLSTTNFRPGTITQSWLWSQLSQWLRPGDILLAEMGTPAIGIMDTRLPSDVTTIAQYLWGSIGYTLPAAQGAALAAKELGRKQRVILFEGDGSFQMTAQAIGTMLEHDLDVVVFLINNDGYTIERWVHGMEEKYNDVPRWKYASIPAAMGGEDGRCVSYQVDSRDGLSGLWESGRFDEPRGMHFVEVFMPREDAPVPLKMLTAAAKAQNSK